MTKTWESFVQLQANSGIQQVVPDTEYVGMSDSEELLRAFGQTGVGETLVDYADDFKQLGLLG